MATKQTSLPDGTLVIDGFSRLFILSPEIAEKHRTASSPLQVSAVEFTTKKGREAVRLESGNTHTFCFRSRSGDRSWDNFGERRITNAIISEAVSASNGGGAWQEINVLKIGIEPISEEQKNAMSEIEPADAPAIDLVVTRHKGLVEWLIEKNIITENTPVINNITDSEVLVGKHVAGVLPVMLAAKCASFVELDLSAVPFEFRGKELPKELVQQYQQGLFTYTVNAGITRHF